MVGKDGVDGRDILLCCWPDDEIGFSFHYAKAINCLNLVIMYLLVISKEAFSGCSPFAPGLSLISME